MSFKPHPRTTPPPPPVEGARWIALTQAKFALVDEEDYELVVGSSWCIAKRGRNTPLFYARCCIYVDGRPTYPYMHALIWKAMGMQNGPDHKDRDGLNNRRSNLRAATPLQQVANRGPYGGNTSGYKGVCWATAPKAWMVQIHIAGKNKFLGLYDDIAEAAKVYDAAALAEYGEFAYLNFPPNAETS